MIDLDHFKTFNDTYGHEAGDAVLREIAVSLTKGVRTEDFVCRFGGEEFVIILPTADLESSLTRAERLRSTMRELTTTHQGRAQTRMATYSWPGNIRELENCIGNACMMVDGTIIDLDDLPEPVRGRSGDVAGKDDLLISLEELQKRHVLRVLEHVGGNKSQAAEILGVSRATIYQFLAQTKAGRLQD